MNNDIEILSNLKHLESEVIRLSTLEGGGGGGGGIIPSCRVYNSANISVVNNTDQPLTFNSERWDTDDIHSTTTNTGRLTCKTAGIYHIYGNIAWAVHSTGVRRIIIRLNGATWIAAWLTPTTGIVVYPQAISTEYSLAVNDYVELLAYQSTGVALVVRVENNYSPEFGMTYLGKAA